MTILFLISTIVTSILAFSFWKKQKQLEDIHAYQKVRTEDWALPSRNMYAFNNQNVTIAQQEDCPVMNEETTPVMTYKSEEINEEIENFYETLVSQNASETNNTDINSIETTDETHVELQEVVNYEVNYFEEENFGEVVSANMEESYPAQETVSNADYDEAFYYAVKGSLDEAAAKLPPVEVFPQNEPVLLSAADWESEEEHSIFLSPIYTDLSSCTIADDQQGLQSWVVQIIGKEQNYLHVSDGTARIWINAENFLDKNLNRGDILFIEVNRSEDGLYLETLGILERNFNINEGSCINHEKEEYQEYDLYEYNLA